MKSVLTPAALQETLRRAAAQVKTASAEPPTSHPSGAPDPGASTPTPGANAAEQTKILKDQVPQSVPNGSPAPADGSTPAPGINNNAVAAGEGPSPTAAASQTPPDPGTSHPADASEKTAAFRRDAGALVSDLRELVKVAAAKVSKQAPVAGSAEEEIKTAALDGRAAGQAAIAAAVNLVNDEREQIKTAAHEASAQGVRDALLFVEFMKKAEAGGAPLVDGAGAGGDGGGGGGAPEGGAPPEADPELQAAIQTLLDSGLTPDQIEAIFAEQGPEGIMAMVAELQASAPQAAAPAPSPEETQKVAALARRAELVKTANLHIKKVCAQLRSGKVG